jgi:hypothetical protein
MSENDESQEPGLMNGVESDAVQETTEEQQLEHRADVETEDEDDEVYERPDWFPEKFWDETEGPDLENLTKSYQELQKQFSQGKHKAPDEYDLSTLSEAGYTDDDPVISAYSDWAKKYGINQVAFDELASQITEMAGSEQAETKLNIEKERKALGQNADAIIQSNVNWADSLLRKGVISEELREELNIWGGSAAGQQLLVTMREMTGDMTKIPVMDVAESSMSENDFKASMQSKMADPRYGSDPAYRQQIEKEFLLRYG